MISSQKKPLSFKIEAFLPIEYNILQNKNSQPLFLTLIQFKSLYMLIDFSIL